jgi:hypothetical protein
MTKSCDYVHKELKKHEKKDMKEMQKMNHAMKEKEPKMAGKGHMMAESIREFDAEHKAHKKHHAHSEHPHHHGHHEMHGGSHKKHHKMKK